MPTYIVRVELLGTPDAETYVKLHDAMKQQGFVQTIIGEQGIYDLPHAEYVRQNAPDETASSVRNKLRPFIGLVYQEFLLVVTKAESSSDISFFLKHSDNS